MSDIIYVFFVHIILDVLLVYMVEIMFSELMIMLIILNLLSYRKYYRIPRIFSIHGNSIQNCKI